MSEKPRIYGTCAAGCLWETVHKSDFEACASIVKCYPNDSGEFILDFYKGYKIVPPKTDGAWGITITGKALVRTSYKPNGFTCTFDFTLPDYDSYADSIKLKTLGFKVDVLNAPTSEDYNYIYRLWAVYEVNGERKQTCIYEEASVKPDTKLDDINDYSFLQIILTVTGATACYIYNEDSTIKSEKGDSAYQVAVNNGFKGTEEEWLASLRKFGVDTEATGLEAIAFGRGSRARGDYSVAGGTNDKSALSAIVGDSLADMITVEPSSADGTGAISYGAGTEATSDGDVSVGILTRTGVKGLYYSSINSSNKTITLSTDRSKAAGSNLASTYGWKVGDTVSFVNGKPYQAYTTITAISGNTITVARLPDTIETYNSLETYRYLPDDFTIWACYKKEVAKATVPIIGTVLAENYRWYPRDGEIELGWAAMAFGVENLGSGSACWISGWNNWGAGDFCSISGRDNIAGYAADARGYNTRALGLASSTRGYNAEASGDYSSAEGANTVASGKYSHAENSAKATAPYAHGEGEASEARGQGSHAGGGATVASGKYSRSDGYYTEAIGDYSTASGDHTRATYKAQTVVGKWNLPTYDLFEVGNGTSENARSNAFSVTRDGTAIVQKAVQIGNTKITEAQLKSLLALLDTGSGGTKEY